MPPEWLLWLLPVPTATLAAVVWAAWSRRARGPEDPETSLREHQRFRAALAPPADRELPRRPLRPPDDQAGSTPRT